MTRDHAYRTLGWRLKQAGIASPELDARLLTRAACGCDEIEMIREPGKRLSEPEEKKLADFETRRLGGEPVSRILGRREFWGLSFRVTPATLDPRPDSETLIETALGLMGGDKSPSILDLGTGTGCLLIALLHERLDAHGIGLDLSQEALEIARQNAVHNHVETRASFRHGVWANGIDERFDLVISNPPYIPAPDIAGLDVEVRDHDPRLALDGGADGLDAYRAIGAALPGLLTPRGHAVIELGQGQDGAVRAIFEGAGLDVSGVVSDLGGIPRALVASLQRG
ncbi:MAG TPA: peptide chain release factor N(5)-glutamine methyltransferase [Parvibaculum sp.]|jgi:release factor glutamine methyltransferase